MLRSNAFRSVLCLAAGLMLSVGCPAEEDPMGSGDEGDEDDAEDTTGGNDSFLDDGNNSMSSDSPTTGDSASASTTAGPTTDPTDPDDTGSFISPPDGGIEGQCDPAAQDCPDGQKCTGYVNTPGGETIDANHCVELMGDLEFGEQCTRIDGNDDCGAGFFCMTDVSGHTGQGICLEYCEVGQACEFGGECFAFNDGQLPLCEQLCHPLAPACSGGQGCYPAFENYVCAIPGAAEGSGNDGDECYVIQGCQPGLFCSGATDGCTTESGCCTPFCDLTEADPCGAPEMCTALAEDPMPGLEDVGGCVVPQ
jgi:hypothetical protein